LDSKIQRSLSPKFGLGESLGENDFTFSLIFGLSPNLGLTERLSERKSEMAPMQRNDECKADVKLGFFLCCLVRLPAELLRNLWITFGK